jgi:hypothetical protein
LINKCVAYQLFRSIPGNQTVVWQHATVLFAVRMGGALGDVMVLDGTL